MSNSNISNIPARRKVGVLSKPDIKRMAYDFVVSRVTMGDDSLIESLSVLVMQRMGRASLKREEGVFISEVSGIIKNLASKGTKDATGSKNYSE